MRLLLRKNVGHRELINISMIDVTIRKLNNTFLYIDSDNGFKYSMSEYYSFFADNYQWSPKFKNRMWDGKIRLFNTAFSTLPIGLLENFKNFCRDNDKTFEVENFDDEPFYEREEIEKDFDRFLSKIKLPEGYEVRDYQRKAVIESILQRRLIIISPTGSGKSFIVYLLLRYLLSRSLIKNKFLIIVPTINLVTQMFSDFVEYAKDEPSFDVEKLCHKISGGKDKTSPKKVYISTWQSIFDIKAQKYFEEFSGIICDEVHTAEAKSIDGIMTKSVNSLYKIGLTGTLKDTKTNPLKLVSLFGEIIHTKTTKELMDLGVLTDTPVMPVVLEYNDEAKKEFWTMVKELKAKQKKTGKAENLYSHELKWLFTYKRRNAIIVKILKSLGDMNTLLLFRSVSHAEYMEKVLKELGFDVYWMKASLNDEEREAIRKYAENNRGVIILSTYQIFQLGINIKNLHNAIFCAPSKGRIRVLQSFGRLLRKATDGRIGWLFDIIDDIRLGSLVNTCYSHGLQRLKYYDEEKLKVKYKAFKI